MGNRPLNTLLPSSISCPLWLWFDSFHPSVSLLSTLPRSLSLPLRFSAWPSRTLGGLCAPVLNQLIFPHWILKACHSSFRGPLWSSRWGTPHPIPSSLPPSPLSLSPVARCPPLLTPFPHPVSTLRNILLLFQEKGPNSGRDEGGHRPGLRIVRYERRIKKKGGGKKMCEEDWGKKRGESVGEFWEMLEGGKERVPQRFRGEAEGCIHTRLPLLKQCTPKPRCVTPCFRMDVSSLSLVCREIGKTAALHPCSVLVSIQFNSVRDKCVLNSLGLVM